MRAAAAEQEFEQATLERNRLRAVRSLLERRRVANESVGTLDAIAVAVDGRRGQRAGISGPRRRALGPPVLLPGERSRARAGEVAEEFILQYYASHISIPPLLVVQRELGVAPALAAALAEALAQRRGGPVELRARRARRQAPDPGARRAQRRGSRSTRSACAPSAAASSRSRRWTAAAGARTGRAADADRVLRHLHPEGTKRSLRWSCSRAARRRSPTTGASSPHGSRRGATRTTSPRWRRSWDGASPSGSASPTSRRTTRTTTRASRRCRTSS